MSSAEFPLRLAGLLRERARDDYGLEEPTPDALASFLQQSCEVPAAAAEALAWGQMAVLSSDELDRIAEVFALQRDLLACVAFPASSEMMRHVLLKVSERDLDLYECARCEDLSERIDLSIDGTASELAALCLEALIHLRPGEDPFGAEESLAHPEDSAMEDVIRVMGALDVEARLRVLAYAYQELARSTNDQLARRNSAYATLRSDYLSSFARKVMDLLAKSNDGSLESAEIVSALSLGNGRSLGQLRRSLESSLDDLAKRGASLSLTDVLVVTRTRGRTRWRLAPEALEAWRALLQAERTLEPSFRS